MSKDHTYQSSKIREVYNYIMASRDSKIAFYFLCLFVLIALFKPFLIGPYPIAFVDANGFHLGFLLNDYNISHVEWKIDYLMAYSPYDINVGNASTLSPFEYNVNSEIQNRHWLGTDIVGRDVLSGLINGAAIAFKVGFISSLLSFILGVMMGGFAGYFGNQEVKVSISSVVLIVVASLYILYAGVYHQYVNILGMVINTGFICLLISIVGLCSIERFMKRGQIFVPIDAMSMRIIELFKSVPSMLVLLVFLTFIETKSLPNVIFIITLLRWPSIAIYARAEMLSIKSKEYVQSAKSIGMSDWRILFKHAIPNTLPSVIVTTAFGISTAILMESTLSFLGLGLESHEVTWGSLLAEARQNFSAWWLAVFPGLALFLVVASINILAEKINEILNPRSNYNT